MSGKFQIRLAACAENYQFIDFESSMALDLSQPVGYADRLTPSIRRGLMAGTLEDMNGEAMKEVEKYIQERQEKKAARKKNGGATISKSSTSAKVLDETKPAEPVITESASISSEDQTSSDDTSNEAPTDEVKVEEVKTYTQEELEAMDVEAVKLIAQDLKVKGKDKETMIAKILEKQNA